MGPVRYLSRRPFFIFRFPRLVQRFDSQITLPISLPHPVDTKVPGDLIQPGENLCLTPESIIMPIGADKSFLSQIGRLFVISEKTIDYIEDPLLILLNERIEIQIAVGIIRWKGVHDAI